MSQLRFRPVAGLMLVLHLAGCVTWQPIYLGPAPPPIEGRVRVTLVTGETIVLREARQEGDTIVGVRWSPKDQTTHLRAANVPVADISAVETRQSSAGFTLAAVMTPFALLGAWVLLVIASDPW